MLVIGVAGKIFTRDASAAVFHVDFKCVHFDQSLQPATRNIQPWTTDEWRQLRLAYVPYSRSQQPGKSSQSGQQAHDGTLILFIGYHVQR